LKELGIEYYKSNGNNKYQVSSEFLHELATTRHWIHEIDDFCEEQPSKDEQGSKQDDELLCKYMQSEKELNRLKNENEQMRLELEALKQAKETSVRIIDDSDEESDFPPEPKLKIEKRSEAPPPKPAKSILSIIDDSDDEGEEEEEDKKVSTKSHKIMKAMECDFID
jgi:hypothetical protein